MKNLFFFFKENLNNLTDRQIIKSFKTYIFNLVWYNIKFLFFNLLKILRSFNL